MTELETNEEIRKFHEERRMFCIYGMKLIIAEPNLPYSHTEWLKNKGWISGEEDSLMKLLVRGIVDKERDIYFYTGYDFNVDERAETIFFPHIKELASTLDLKSQTKIFGGMIPRESGKIWLPKKDYGTIEDYL